MDDWAETWVLCEGLDPYRRDRPVLLRLPKAQRLGNLPLFLDLFHCLYLTQILMDFGQILDSKSYDQAEQSL